MRRVVTVIVALAAVGLIAASAAAMWALRPAATPSSEMTAVPVQQATQPPEQPTQAEAGAEEPQTAGEAAVFDLVQAESEARFLINEILSGQPKTVIGVTNQLAGQILINPADPAATQIGPIAVNARTLVTDNGSRNRAIHNIILQTGPFEFITFTPKQISGLPDSVAVGQTFSFQVLGDLQIKDIVREVTFEVTVTVDSETRLHGLASATIIRDDFGLGLIQTPPQVASVEHEVILELEFVAVSQ